MMSIWTMGKQADALRARIDSGRVPPALESHYREILANWETHIEIVMAMTEAA